MSKFSLPTDELIRTWQPIPSGRYRGDVVALTLTDEYDEDEQAERRAMGKDPLWRGIKGTVANITTTTGEDFAEQGTERVSLIGKTLDFLLTVEASNPQSWMVEQVLRFANAIGAAHENGDGMTEIEGDTTEEVYYELLNNIPAHVNFAVRTGPRIAKDKTPVLRPGTDEPYIDERITSFWAEQKRVH